MVMPERASTHFRRLVHGPELLLIPGGFSPLAARMIEAAGLHAFFLAGSQTSAYVYGLPDVGIMGRQEMLDAIRRVTDVSNVCVFADADTGFGSALNVYTTVQAYIRSGAAGMHIEDQEFPKRSGTTSGRRCISVAEAVGKYRAAVAAKNELDPDFVFCARCDLIGAEDGSFEAAVERCIAYVEDASVDMIWLNNVQTIDQVALAIERIPGPVMPTYGGPQPGPTLDQLQEFGASAAIFPGMTSSTGLQQTWDLLNDLRERGQPALDDRRVPAEASRWGRVRFDTFVSPSQERVKEIEATFLSEEQQRDYGSTFGFSAPPSGTS
jgi:2-methylisocitrate lyase-like PEP mutase family enzyme